MPPTLLDIVAQEPHSQKLFLLIHAADLEPAARAWAEYRREDGWTVQLESIAPLQSAADADGETARRQLIHDLIRTRFAELRDDGGAELVVMLLGDADERGLPTWSFPQHDPSLLDGRDDHYVSDHPYQCIDLEDERPDVALGRVPARTVTEANCLLEKIKRYERDAPPGVWRRRVNYAAGEGHFGGLDLLMEMMFLGMVQRQVPEAYDLSMTYAKAASIYCPPPDRLTETFLRRLEEGALLFNYVGHGSASGLDYLTVGDRQQAMLQIGDLLRLDPSNDRMPIALLTCCSAGWYDLPQGRPSLAEAMLFQPGGPIAVIAGSRPTHPYANAILQKDVTQFLLVDRLGTAGQIDLAATRSMLTEDATDRQLDAIATPLARAGGWKTSLAGLRQMHVRLYNLLGDPALRIAYPSRVIEPITLESGLVGASVPSMTSGRATITVEAAVGSMTRPMDMLTVLGATDPDLVAKTDHNYPLANERIFQQVEAEVRNGRFDALLPGELAPGATLIKVFAVGRDESGTVFDAFGSLHLPER